MTESFIKVDIDVYIVPRGVQHKAKDVVPMNVLKKFGRIRKHKDIFYLYEAEKLKSLGEIEDYLNL